MTRIIVVEDDPEQQEELLAFLTYSGHETLGASDGASLIRSLNTFTPDIVLLDYNLPHDNGALIAERLRERFGVSVGIVMVTARNLAIDRVECRRAGADDYLVKPIEFGELLALIDNLYKRINPASGVSNAWVLRVQHSELIPPDSPGIPLSPWEVLLLTTIANSGQQRANIDELAQALGSNPSACDTKTLETLISRLRHKLPLIDQDHYPLEPIPGAGYQFIKPLVVES